MSQEIRVKGKAARVRGATWTNFQVDKLFEVWTQPSVYKGLLNEKKKQGIFKSMAATLTSLGVIRTWQECRAKIKNLKADFRKAIEKKTPFRYYDQMSKVMNLDGSATTSGGGASSRSGGTTPADSESRCKYEDDDNYEHSDMDDEDLQPETITPTKTIVMPNDPTVDEEAIGMSVIKSPSTSTSTYPARTPTYYEEPRSVGMTSYHESEYITPSTPPSPFVQRQQYSDSPQHTRRHQSYEDDKEQSQYHARHHHHRHHHQQQQEIRNEYEQDSSSRSSMIITHVVSSVIEPVTTVVMPSSNNFRNRVAPAPPSPEMLVPDSLQQPIRLEFVVDDDNLILQTPSPNSKQGHSNVGSLESHQFQAYSSSHRSPPPASLPSPPHSPVVATTSSHSKNPTTFSNSNLTSITPPKKRPIPPPPTTPSNTALKQRLKQKRVRAPPPPDSPHQREKATTSVEHGKKRKLLETLNKKTVETISTLLTETSQTLLKEIQDAEHRFILWEEEKRNDERKREEAMFSKLMHAMKVAAAPPPNNANDNPSTLPEVDEEDSAFITTFTGVSKRLNAMVNDEIKATEETLKQWEMKMQRQESRHSEKLFAMIINAIKTPTSQQD